MLEQDKYIIIIKEEDLPLKRLDLLIKEKIPELSRSYIKDLFQKKHITSSTPLSLKKIPIIGTEILINIPVPEKSELLAEDIPLEILFEDQYLLFVNKPAGMVVHPAVGNWNGTLVNALLHHCNDLKGIGNVERPGIVHRLDKGTSGIMVVAKEQKTHELLVEIFRNHDIERKYEALTYGKLFPKKDTVTSFIKRDSRNRQKMTSKVNDGKTAITNYLVLKEFFNTSHVELLLETGRTHQIRVHLAQEKRTPILNDHTYGNYKKHLKAIPQLKEILENYEYPFLHAKLLALKHPITGEDLSFEVPPPLIFQKVLEILNN